jgi:hypothetical protein
LIRGWAVEAQPLTVSGGRNLEVRHEGVVRPDFDLVDECLDEGLLAVMRC